MVYYYTSKNIKLIQNIIIDYGASNEMSPHEYMKMYIEKCPENIHDSKISWIIETFLGVQKHSQFLKEITCQLFSELSEENQDYFVIIFYAIVFQITPKDATYLYKCIFNLSKSLLFTVTQVLSNNEVLPLISQIAQVEYDTTFVTDKIIAPLFQWQPYISKMSHDYEEYVKKNEIRNQKLPTIPIEPNLLHRKGRSTHNHKIEEPDYVSINKVFNKRSKMLSKSKIDMNLKNSHKKNKQKAIQLLNLVKNNNDHYGQEKSENKKHCLIEDEKKYPSKKCVFRTNSSKAPKVKETTATITRLNKRIKQCEQEEVQWLEDLVGNCKNTSKLKDLLNYDHQERERERLIDIEKKHLMGLISYEEAVIAKKNILTKNKRKYEDFLKEKHIWEREIDQWKTLQIEKNRKQVEKLSMIELNVIQAKHNLSTKKKEIAEQLRLESENIKEIALKNKQAELERRANMIKEIKILAVVAKKAKLQKIIDLTESSGLGLLCEMSIAELQERLTIMKIGLKEELEKKRDGIKKLNLEKKQELKETEESINSYLSEKASLRKGSKKNKISKSYATSTSEINQLKEILKEKRELRLLLTK